MREKSPLARIASGPLRRGARHEPSRLMRLLVPTALAAAPAPLSRIQLRESLFASEDTGLRQTPRRTSAPARRVVTARPQDAGPTVRQVTPQNAPATPSPVGRPQPATWDSSGMEDAQQAAPLSDRAIPLQPQPALQQVDRLSPAPAMPITRSQAAEVPPAPPRPEPVSQRDHATAVTKAVEVRTPVDHKRTRPEFEPSANVPPSPVPPQKPAKTIARHKKWVMPAPILVAVSPPPDASRQSTRTAEAIRPVRQLSAPAVDAGTETTRVDMSGKRPGRRDRPPREAGDGPRPAPRKLAATPTRQASPTPVAVELAPAPMLPRLVARGTEAAPPSQSKQPVAASRVAIHIGRVEILTKASDRSPARIIEPRRHQIDPGLRF